MASMEGMRENSNNLCIDDKVNITKRVNYPTNGVVTTIYTTIGLILLVTKLYL